MRRLHERFTSAKCRKAAFLLLLILAMGCSVSACGEVAGTDTNPAAQTEEGQAAKERAQESQQDGPPAKQQEQAVGQEEPSAEVQTKEVLSVEEIAASYEAQITEVPAYTGNAYTIINDNNPYFTKSNLPTTSFEYYSQLDGLGRCGIACANIGQDIMPTKERESIGQVKPSGWQTVKYDNVDGKYLYNRCHLIGYQLSAENANEKNLITGTRYLNVMGMLPFENMVADYVKETGNHVLYRVNPYFQGDNLLASGVFMEGWSVEDGGEGICFHVFVYNVQPGIAIDYANGDSHSDEDMPAANEPATAEASDKGSAAQDNNQSDDPVSKEVTEQSEPAPAGTDYILNTNTYKFHIPACGSVKQMSEANKKTYAGNRDDVIAMGYDPCKKCNP